MHIVSLIAAPGRLDPALAGSLRNAWGGGDVVWLSQGEAAEFAVERLPPDLAAQRDEVRALGVDLNTLPAAHRRKRLLLADMDSTMIGQECIDELASLAGVGTEVAAITSRAMNGELDFEGALTARLALMEGLDAAMIDRVWAERITLAPGGRTLVATMRAGGAHTALVSGGFTAFTERVAAVLGFDSHRANVLGVREGRLTGRVDGPILGREAKVAALEALSRDLDLRPEDTLAVGDGANDLGMIGRAGMGVALHAKPAVAAEAPFRIDHGDLTALLFLQGYARDAFA